MTKEIKTLSRYFILLVVLGGIAFAGYEAFRPKPDPLAGWWVDANHEPDNAIVKNYQNYINTLSPNERKYLGPIAFFANGTGQHAVVIEIDLNGTAWNHVLFYDKNDRRTKILKYAGYHYMS